VAQGRGQGRAVVNTGVNLPFPQKAVSKGLRNWWAVGCTWNCTAILNSLHIHSRKGKFVALLKNIIIIIIVIYQLLSNL
jgi:hypothetical protein